MSRRRSCCPCWPRWLTSVFPTSGKFLPTSGKVLRSLGRVFPASGKGSRASGRVFLVQGKVFPSQGKSSRSPEESSRPRERSSRTPGRVFPTRGKTLPSVGETFPELQKSTPLDVNRRAWPETPPPERRSTIAEVGIGGEATTACRRGAILRTASTPRSGVSRDGRGCRPSGVRRAGRGSPRSRPAAPRWSRRPARTGP